MRCGYIHSRNFTVFELRTVASTPRKYFLITFIPGESLVVAGSETLHKDSAFTRLEPWSKTKLTQDRFLHSTRCGWSQCLGTKIRLLKFTKLPKSCVTQSLGKFTDAGAHRRS